MSDITVLLSRWRDGDPSAEAPLIEQVYPVLRQIAQARLGRSDAITLAATELAHEAYFKLIAQRTDPIENRSHFFAIAAHVIRRLLIDHLRERHALKRGGDAVQVTLGAAEAVAAPAPDAVDVLDLDRLLQRLERINPRAGRLVELRYFAGMTNEEAADVLHVSNQTAKRDWQFARAWLHQQLADPSGD